MVFQNSVSIETSLEQKFEFFPDAYPSRPPYYQGRYKFQKHYYPTIEDLKSQGEEFECAQTIDRNSRVKHWVRNLVNRDKASFSLPLAGRNFYPDFVVELNDGRVLIVEYKGNVYRTNDDSREKHLIGENWALRSSGKCLFLMAEKQNLEGLDVYQQIDKAISNP